MSETSAWCVVPAAGAGRRMGADRPKQYLELCGRKVIEHTLEGLCDHEQIRAVCVVLSPGDSYWSGVQLSSTERLLCCDGGAERYQSVVNGLHALSTHGASSDDWVVVHDAVRPCLRRKDIDRLLREGGDHAIGGVLGLPVRDTMKRADRTGNIEDTVSRDRLWHAFTPQMFRLGALTSALQDVIAHGIAVTDEAQAMERTGAYAKMVEGHADNIKITTPGDLALAEQYLLAQGKES